MRVQRHRAAIRRTAGSTPVRWLLDSGFLSPGDSVFDYGCGHGDDVTLLNSLGFRASGWDPHFLPDHPKQSATAVNLGYVLNVIEEHRERRDVLKEAWELAERLLLVAVRTRSDQPADPGRPLGDGYYTRLGTFQKFYEPGELNDLLEGTLGTKSVPLNPGLHVVFREAKDRQQCAARQFRRTRRPVAEAHLADALYLDRKEEFDSLVRFWGDRGRMPKSDEHTAIRELRASVGSRKRIRTILARVAGEAWLERAARESAEDLLVYFAMEKFAGRPRFSDLHQSIQGDVKSHYRSYMRACEEADSLLMSLGNPLVLDAACRDSSIGKLTGSALYVHRSALNRLEPVLRAYEGCARVLLGEVEGANIIKFHRRKAAISHLSYPDFDDVAHPTLRWSLHTDLRKLRTTFEDYSQRSNPPVLHRKEEFVAEDYEGRKV